MKEVLAAAVALAGAVTSALSAQSTPPGKMHTRQVFVAVTDRGGAPVLDLTANDFEIKENGVARPIDRAGLARSPMRIALVIDTSDSTTEAVSMIRKGLADFLDALPPQHEVLMASTGRQMRVRVPPTTDRKKLGDAARGLFSDGGATRLMDGLLEIDDRFMKDAEDRWPVFVIVTGDGAESSAGGNEKKFNDWVRGLPARGIVAHGIVLKYKGQGMPEVVTSQMAQTTGGRYDFMNTSNSLPAKLAAIAEQLNRDFAAVQTKYAIAFHTDAADAGRVSIGVARQGVTLQLTNGRLR
jgi:von Willebrand factor type A domain